MSESTNAKSDGLAASPMDRRDFLKGAASAAGTVVAASVSETARATPASKPGRCIEAKLSMCVQAVNGIKSEIETINALPASLLRKAFRGEL